MPVPPSELLAWHARHGAFERLMPPWETLSVARRILGDQKTPSGEVVRSPIGDGAVLEMRLHKGPMRLPWVADHHSFRDETDPNDKTADGGARFMDTQAKGPFASWDHEHKFLPSPVFPTHSELEDDVRYRVPGGTLGAALGGEYAAGVLEKMFAFRHARTHADLARHARFADRRPKRIVIAGGSGLIGSQLVPYLQGAGHEIVRLVRRPERRELAESGGGDRALDGAVERRWDPAAGRLDADALEGADAVINLSGHNVASGRYTDDEKRHIRDSRVNATTLLTETMASMSGGPRVLLQASAVGYYGDHPRAGGDLQLDESSPRGDGFLASVCEDWEAAASPAVDAGIRTVFMRIGVVLSPRGGALIKTLPLFQLGLGGPLGPGTQVWPWIALDDVLGAVEFLLQHDDASGPINICAPEPVTNGVFTGVLGSVLKRPTFLRAPTWAIEAALGEMARETALKSVPAVPRRLRELGFTLDHPTVEDALRWELWKPAPKS